MDATGGAEKQQILRRPTILSWKPVLGLVWSSDGKSCDVNWGMIGKDGERTFEYVLCKAGVSVVAQASRLEEANIRRPTKWRRKPPLGLV